MTPQSGGVIDLDNLTEEITESDLDEFNCGETNQQRDETDPELEQVGEHIEPFRKKTRKSFFDVDNLSVVSSDDMRPEVKVSVYLLGELYAMGTSDISILLNTKRRARAAPIQLNAMFNNEKLKLKCLLEIISHAELESDGSYGFSHIARKFGRIEEDTKKAVLSRSWNDQSLEAKHLEHSCKSSLRKEFVSPDLNVYSLSRHGRTARMMAQRLLRAVNEEYETVSAEAAGSAFRFERDLTLELLRETPMRETVAIFTRFAAKYLMAISSQAFISLTSHLEPLLLERRVYKKPSEEGPMLALHNMIGMMDVVELGVERLISQTNNSWLNISLDNLDFAKKNFVHFSDKAIDPPPFVSQLALQMDHWEKLIKCDVPQLRDIDPIIFETITMGVTMQRVLRTWANEDSGSADGQKVMRPYARLLTQALREKEPTRSQDILQALNTYSGLLTAGSSGSASVDLFTTIELMTHSYGVDAGTPDPDRVRLIYYQITDMACQASGTFSLTGFLTRLSYDLVFHLRAKNVVARLDRLQKERVLCMQSLTFAEIKHFEDICTTAPVSTRTVAFLTTVFTFLLTTNTASAGVVGKKGDAPLQRLILPNAPEEFTILNLAWRKQSDQLKIVHPIQFEHKPWMKADDRGIYRMLPSQALMGSMARAFSRTRPPMLEAADCLSRVGWRFNRFIMHVEELIVLEGYGFHKIMPSFFPVASLSMSTGYIPCKSLEDVKANKKLLYHPVTLKLRRNQHSLDHYFERGVSGNRRNHLITLRTVRTIVDKPQFFIPQKLDFRGRMYALSGHTNPGGSDPHRALMDFSTAKPLGKHGLYWLKIHFANMMGNNKLSFEERVQYADDHMDDIIQSAESPLGGDRLWQEGSEPLQALRACKEIHDALSHSQGVENFESYLPVQIDGTCNGLQHYSAIARDELGGRRVNLVPTSRPNDVYTAVMNTMLPLIHEDANHDNIVAQRVIGTGKNLDSNHLTRKTIKTAVMTQVYGVTNYGMLAMIEKELSVQNQAHNLWSNSMIGDISRYLREKLLQALGITFRRAGKCRDWMNQTIDTIWQCQPEMSKQCFQWTTPLGLIVRQPYTKGILTSIFTPQGTIRVECSQVNHASKRQLAAFAPNLIHSLDACHLAMTALEMDRIGLKIAAVHDSFWTHACDLPILSRVLRQEFANLYTNCDPLWELKEQMEEQFAPDLRRHGIKLKDPPEKGNLDLKEIMKSKYFFA
ncbi:mitochondrial DNA-directed RNA polymerase [Perkinsela sp. CCAP 1560/4]|nr:mitochondrial DNA-directed RNA polymerase [Perkinsela sp. CCAP 1560/4]|eukprot:KNH09228.1 mitochondrial DNA-directed RNA polymerase [Perkinsela sp. CCAP 1560/4]